MWTLLVLGSLALQDPKPDSKIDVEHTRLLVYDAARQMTFRIQKDGRVELAVAEADLQTGKKVPKTYSAPSAAEFRMTYPGLVAHYNLGRHLGAPPALTQREFEDWWRSLQGAPSAPVPGLDRDLGRRLEELRRSFLVPGSEAPSALAPTPVRDFGARVEEVGETLRDQLSLGENEGVLVTELRPGSVAEKAGLRRHDLLLKLEGHTVTDRWEFRLDVQAALGRSSFEIELLRGGKRLTVPVRTGARKDE